MQAPAFRAAAIAAIAVVLTGCAGISGPPPTISSASDSPSLSGSPSASALAIVPTDQLTFPGKLVICSDLPYPPQEFFDDQANPIGSDIEIGQ